MFWSTTSLLISTWFGAGKLEIQELWIFRRISSPRDVVYHCKCVLFAWFSVALPPRLSGETRRSERSIVRMRSGERLRLERENTFENGLSPLKY